MPAVIKKVKENNSDAKATSAFETGVIEDLRRRSANITTELAQLDRQRVTLLAEQKRINAALRTLR